MAQKNMLSSLHCLQELARPKWLWKDWPVPSHSQSLPHWHSPSQYRLPPFCSCDLSSLVSEPTPNPQHRASLQQPTCLGTRMRTTSLAPNQGGKG